MSAARPRVLLFSQRNICEIEVWRAGGREFEDTICEVDSVEVLAPRRGRWFDQRMRFAQRVGKRSRILLNPGIPKIRLDGHYDLFFAICEKPSELLNIDAVEDWKRHCTTSVCVMAEMWVKDIPTFKSALEVLAKFDYVMSYFAQSVEPLGQATGTTCLYMPPAVDVVRFSPYPNRPDRCIDVLSVGRRLPVVHRALLGMTRGNGMFYVYDTIKDLHTDDLDEHRSLMASLAKRSRYFVVNPAKCDTPEERGDQSEGGARYFEGTAAGAILIGESPKNGPFNEALGWPDAVVPLPHDPRAIEDVLGGLDRQPERQERIRRTNVVRALLRHDWVHRWETVLGTVKLEPMPELLKRKQRLARLARTVEEGVVLG